MRQEPNPLIEPYRVTAGELATPAGVNYGFFKITQIPSWSAHHGTTPEDLHVISDGANPDWEHVSVTCYTRWPSWPEMQMVRMMFWDEHEHVIQIHLENIEAYTLHLWRSVADPIRLPPDDMLITFPEPF